MVGGTDGPKQVSVEELDAMDRGMWNLAEFAEDLRVAIAIKFNWSRIVTGLQSVVLVAETADHPRVGVICGTAHYHVTATKPRDISEDSVRYIKHVNLNHMPDTPEDLTHRNFDRVLPGEGMLDMPEIPRSMGGFFR